MTDLELCVHFNKYVFEVHKDGNKCTPITEFNLSNIKIYEN